MIWGLDNNFHNTISECECNAIGKQNDTCNGETGQCHCKLNYDGLKCDTCAKTFFNFPECIGNHWFMNQHHLSCLKILECVSSSPQIATVSRMDLWQVCAIRKESVHANQHLMVISVRDVHMTISIFQTVQVSLWISNPCSYRNVWKHSKFVSFYRVQLSQRRICGGNNLWPLWKMWM